MYMIYIRIIDIRGYYAISNAVVQRRSANVFQLLSSYLGNAFTYGQARAFTPVHAKKSVMNVSASNGLTAIVEL